MSKQADCVVSFTVFLKKNIVEHHFIIQAPMYMTHSEPLH